MLSNEGENKKLLCGDAGKENFEERRVVYIDFKTVTLKQIHSSRAVSTNWYPRRV